jgi:hypothetical protein
MFFRKAAPAAPAASVTPADRRADQRVRYPAARAERRPFFLWVGESARVLECSTRGLRLEMPSYADCPRAGDRLVGRVVLHDRTVAVDGTVRHVRNRIVGLELRAPGIPSDALRAEERHLAEHVPSVRLR